jgi:dipeptidyl aminopeptidase/acylaminoacyl peptidase
MALLVAATACSGSGDDKTSTPAAPAERHLTFVGGELEATERKTEAKSSVWIADPSGAHARKLTNGFLGLLSPDGKTVAVQRLGKGIFLVSSDGKETKQLTAAPQLRPQAWSPDGKFVYVTADAGNAVVRLAAVDRDSGKVKTIATGSLYGIDTSPDGKQIVYSRAPEATEQGICGDQFDLYVAKLDGSGAKRITTDGLSAFPVWGDGGIAFTHFPGGTALSDCGAAGIGTIQPDGSGRKSVIERMPESLTLLGFYGYQPLGWLGRDRLLVGLRSDAGTEGAVLDVGSGKLRRFNQMADQASSDGRFALGSGGDEGNAVIVVRLGDGRVVFKRKNVCCPDWNR